MAWKSSFRQNYRTTFSPTVPTSAAGISHVAADVEAPVGEKWEHLKSGGKQWQATPKNLPMMQRTRAIPFAWLNSGLCPHRPKGWIPIIIIIYIFLFSYYPVAPKQYRWSVTDDVSICAQVREQDERARGCGTKIQTEGQGTTWNEDETQWVAHHEDGACHIPLLPDMLPAYHHSQSGRRRSSVPRYTVFVPNVGCACVCVCVSLVCGKPAVISQTRFKPHSPSHCCYFCTKLHGVTSEKR